MSTKLKLLSTFILLLVGQLFYSQVTGTLVDEDNLGLSNVIVTVEGSNVSTVTDFEGNFDINAKVGDVLSFDDLGNVMTKNVTNVNMGTLTMTKSLDEVEVLGNIFLKDVDQIQTGISKVSSEEIKDYTQTMSAEQMLQGKAAGVQVTGLNGKPGEGANIRIRDVGIGSGTSQPLYVVDGAYVTSRDVQAIDPNTIEDYVVIKDAASAALYGSLGANGVVIINTKKGTGDGSNSSFNFSTQFGTTQVTDFGFDLMNARQKLDYEKQLTDLGLVTNTGSLSDAQRDELAANGHNWKDDILKTGNLSSYKFNAGYSNNKSNTNFSIGYDDNTGAIQYLKGFNRISGGFANETKFNDFIKMGVNINGAYTTSDEPRDRNNVQNPIWAVYNYNPYAPLYTYDADGNIIYGQDGLPEYNLNNLGSFGFQIIEALQNEKEQERYFRMFGNVFAEMNITKDITFRTQFNPNYVRYQREIFYTPDSQLSTILFSGNGQKTDNGYDRLNYAWSNSLGYKHTFKEKHYLSGFVFSEYRKNNIYQYQLTSQGFPNNVLDVQSIATTPITTTTGRSVNVLFGVGASVAYNYAEKYFIEGFLRRDGYSKFGKDAKHSDFFGFSLAWDMKKENFLNSVDWINMLKLRGSYGEVGNSGFLGDYDSETVINFYPYPTGGAAASSVTKGNPYLSFEKNDKTEIGMDFEFLRRKLRGGLSYFKNVRGAFIFTDDLPYESGVFDSQVNSGKIDASGVELELAYDVIKNSNVNFKVYVNFTSLKTKTKELNGLDEVDLGVTGQKVGEEAFTYELVRYAGVDPANGQSLYYDADGNVTNVYNPDDNVYLSGKSPNPDYYGGFGFSLDYKGFDLVSDFVYSHGSYVLNYIYQNATSFDNNIDNMSTDAFNYWKNPGDTNVLPKPAVGSVVRTTDQYLQDNSYLRFRNLSLGYTFTKDFLGNYVPVKQIRFYVSAQNLLTWTKYKGDPEVGIGSGESNNAANPLVPGAYSLYSYPTLKTFLVGFNVQF